jgi:hypothetical protein
MIAGPHFFKLIATNSAGEQSGEPCSLSVTHGPLSINGCPLPEARFGEPYSALLRGVGGSAPYSFTVQGVMPAGLTLTTGGQVTGTPNRTGTFPFSVMVRDGSFSTKVQSCSVTVPPPVLRFTTSCPLPDGEAGVAYSAQLAASGGVTPYRFFTPDLLPEGLSMTEAGAISGTPTRNGGQTFAIYVVDSAGDFSTQVCSINVARPNAPAISLGDIPATVQPAVTNFGIPIRLAAPFRAPVQGLVKLTINADTRSTDAIANSADPRLAFANG